MKHILILIILLVLGNFCSAQKIQDNKTHTLNSNELSEGHAYKMLYENQIKANDQISKAVFYALGGLGTAMLLVFASNWWFNEKKVKDAIADIDAKIKGIRNELFAEISERNNTMMIDKTAELNQFQIKLQEEITNEIKTNSLKINELSQTLRSEIKLDVQILSENYQKYLDSFNETYHSQLSIFNDSLRDRYDDLKELIKDKESSLKILVSTEEKKRIEDINDTKQLLSRVEFYMWKHSGVHRNSFAALLKEISIKLTLGHENHFFLPLEQLLDTINLCTHILERDKIEAIDVLSKLPDDESLNILKSKILDKINTIKIQK